MKDENKNPGDPASVATGGYKRQNNPLVAILLRAEKDNAPF